MYPILDDFNDTRTFTDKEIFTQLWTQPRAVLQYIHENQYEKYLNPLLFLLGVIAGLNRAVEKEMGDEIPLLGIIGGAILIGGLLGWISYYIYAGLVSWTGKWLNGVGNAYDVLRIFAYASIPTVLTLVLFAVQIIVYGNGVFSSEMTSTFVNYTTADILFYGSLIAELLLGVLTIVFCVIGISVVQEFSIGKAVLNLILPALVIAVPIVLLVLIFT